MSGISDLVSRELLQPGAQTPLLMSATVLDTVPLVLQVPAIDGGKHALEAFGHFPDAQPGDQLRVMLDHFGQVVIVAWQPASA
jgi:hypothetical protein